MLGGFLSGLIIAWFLNIFNIGYMLIEGIQPFFLANLNIGTYYIFMASLGTFGGLVKDIFGGK